MADVDRLFEVPLDQFVTERDALARSLKKEGDAAGAAEVKALRKPSVAAWAVNQAVRADPDGADELVDAGRAAQRQAVEGGGAGDLREATKRLRAAIAGLVAVAQQHSAGTADQVERVTATLQAAASSEAAAELVRAGQLSTELDPSGFGEAAGDEPPTARR